MDAIEPTPVVTVDAYEQFWQYADGDDLPPPAPDAHAADAYDLYWDLNDGN